MDQEVPVVQISHPTLETLTLLGWGDRFQLTFLSSLRHVSIREIAKKDYLS